MTVSKHYALRGARVNRCAEVIFGNDHDFKAVFRSLHPKGRCTFSRRQPSETEVKPHVFHNVSIEHARLFSAGRSLCFYIYSLNPVW